MKKLFQTIFVSALSILLFTMPAFAAAPEAEETAARQDEA